MCHIIEHRIIGINCISNKLLCSFRLVNVEQSMQDGVFHQRACIQYQKVFIEKNSCKGKLFKSKFDDGVAYYGRLSMRWV